MSSVTFHLKVPTAIGESIAVIGDVAELGAWDPLRAVDLHTNASSFPNWSVTLALPLQSKLNYKYVLKSNGVVSKWEEFEGNRTLTVHAPALQVQDGEFNVIQTDPNHIQVPTQKENTHPVRSLRNGVETLFYPGTQQKRTEYNWNDGVLNGPETGWFLNGNLSYTRIRKNNKLNGEEKRYHENGQLAAVWTWTEQKVVGEDKGFHPNGNQAYIRFYDEQMKTKGEEKRWHENGQIKLQKFWKDGFEDGQEQRWYADGKMQSDVAWDAGRKMAEKKFKEDGQIESEIIWDQGGGIKFSKKY